MLTCMAPLIVNFYFIYKKKKKSPDFIKNHSISRSKTVSFGSIQFLQSMAKLKNRRKINQMKTKRNKKSIRYVNNIMEMKNNKENATSKNAPQGVFN